MDTAATVTDGATVTADTERATDTDTDTEATEKVTEDTESTVSTTNRNCFYPEKTSHYSDTAIHYALLLFRERSSSHIS